MTQDDLAEVLAEQITANEADDQAEAPAAVAEVPAMPGSGMEWMPKGTYGIATGGGPLEVGGDLKGEVLVTLRFSTKRSGRADVSAAADAFTLGVREQTLADLEKEDVHLQLVAVRPQYRQANAEAEQAERALAEAENRLADLKELRPVPADLGTRLVSLRQAVTDAEVVVNTKKAILRELAPVYRAASEKIEPKLGELMMAAHRRAYEESVERVRQRLAELAQDAGTALTELALLVRGRTAFTMPQVVALAREVINAPDSLPGLDDQEQTQAG